MQLIKENLHITGGSGKKHLGFTGSHDVEWEAMKNALGQDGKSVDLEYNVYKMEKDELEIYQPIVSGATIENFPKVSENEDV